MPSSNKQTSKIIDGVLKHLAFSGALAIGILAPSAWTLLDKPLQNYFKTLDKRAREREWSRVVSYMKKNRLIAEDYAYGLTITKAGKLRAGKAVFEQMFIPIPQRWDGSWRLVFYDIPEKHKAGRNALTLKLRSLGFFQLQRSVWVHPLPCRREIEAIAIEYKLQKYVTYMKSSYIDKQALLKQQFPILKQIA